MSFEFKDVNFRDQNTCRNCNNKGMFGRSNPYEQYRYFNCKILKYKFDYYKSENSICDKWESIHISTPKEIALSKLSNDDKIVLGLI